MIGQAGMARIACDAGTVRWCGPPSTFRPAVHRRARELAQRRHQSLSAVVADLTVRGLASLDEPLRIDTDPVSGFPVVSLGRRVTSADVAEALDEG